MIKKNHLILVCLVIITCFLSLPAFANGDIIFEDDFTDEEIKGDWLVNLSFADDFNIVKDDISYLEQSSTDDLIPLYLSLKEENDITIEVDVKPMDFGGEGAKFIIFFRNNSPSTSDAYRFEFDYDPQKINIATINGGYNVFASESYEIEPGQWYNVKLVVKGNKIEAFIDDEEVISVEDDTFQTGNYIAFTGWRTSFALDNVIISEVE